MVKHFNFPIYFKHARWGQLVIPDDLSREDFELLRQQIDNHLWTIEEALLSAPDGAAQDAPSEAVTAAPVSS